MALFIIGGVRADLVFNINAAREEGREEFARHDVMGARRSFEDVGDGEETLDLKGVIFPRALGGMAEYNLLNDLRRSRQAVYVTRGREVLGWYYITRLGRDDEYLDSQGQGRKIEFNINLDKTDRPSLASNAANLLTRLFGYA